MRIKEGIMSDEIKVNGICHCGEIEITAKIKK